MKSIRRLARVFVVLPAVLVAACSPFTPEVLDVIGEPDSMRVEFSVDTCNQNPQVSIVETATEVRFTVTAARNDGDSDDCLDTAEVTLDEPLGDRMVVDDVTDMTWAITPEEGRG